MLDRSKHVVADQGHIAFRDARGWLLAKSVPERAQLSVLAVCSDDPETWEEMQQLWPRYRTPVVPESILDLAWEPATFDQVKDALACDPEFLLIDLVTRKLATGTEWADYGSDHNLSLDLSAAENEALPKSHNRSLQRCRCPLAIHLPPWWTLLARVSGKDAIEHPAKKAQRPLSQRDILFGDALYEAFAIDLIGEFEKECQRGTFSDDPAEMDWEHPDHPNNIPFSTLVQIHKAWLMTPRLELQGRTPRDLLHGHFEWIEGLSQSQENRFLSGLPIVAAPASLASLSQGPVGRSEMVMYFELCRHVIATGWQHLYRTMRECGSIDELPFTANGVLFDTQGLKAYMQNAGTEWLDQSYEEGSPPRFIIECERRRVPRIVNAPIDGIAERETDDHASHCECDICNMMSSGLLGPTISTVNGYYLDFEEEFAFSSYETREEWYDAMVDFGIDVDWKKSTPVETEVVH